MKIAFLADPIETFDKSHDSTWALMLEANRLGHEIYYAPAVIANTVKQSSSSSNITKGYALFHKLDDNFFYLQKNQYAKNKSVIFPEELRDKTCSQIQLDDFDIIFMRKDPPVDMDYIVQTQILSLCKKALVVNDPKALRDYNEKLSILNFPDLIAPTMVSSNKQDFRIFLQQHKKIVIKPLDGKGGQGIFVVQENDKNFWSVVENSTSYGQRVAMAQKYIPAITNEGDKRIILVNGEPIGAMLRIPAEDDHRGNMAAGSSIAKYTLNKRDMEICEKLKPFCVSNGIYFAGIDLIGDYLTEINITSPTCLQEINRLNGLEGEQKLEYIILAALENL